MTDRSSELTTHFGFKFRVRPVQPEDQDALQAFFAKVTPEDLRFRFLGTVKEVGHDRLAAMIAVDHVRTESVVAFESAGGPIIAAAMLACDEQLETAEVAVSISGGYKNRGIGWELLGHLTRLAEAKGVKRLQCLEDRSNVAAIRLEKEMGFSANPYLGDTTLVVLEKALAPASDGRGP